MSLTTLLNLNSRYCEKRIYYYQNLLYTITHTTTHYLIRRRYSESIENWQVHDRHRHGYKTIRNYDAP